MEAAYAVLDPGRQPMTDAGLLGKASIDWDHLDATDATGER